MKRLSNIFLAISLLLSHIMCIDTAVTYMKLYYGGLYEGYSAPPETAFVTIIPYAVIIAVLLTISALLKRRAK